MCIDQLDINADVAAIQMAFMKTSVDEEDKHQAEQQQQQHLQQQQQQPDTRQQHDETLAPSNGQQSQQDDISPCWICGALADESSNGNISKTTPMELHL